MYPIKFEEANIDIAKDQPQYMPLPALYLKDNHGEVISCWSVSWRERLKLLFTGKLWISKLTFNQPLQPYLLTVDKQHLHSLKIKK